MNHKFLITILSQLIFSPLLLANSDCEGNSYELGIASNLLIMSQGGNSLAYTSDSAGCRVIFEYWSHNETVTGYVNFNKNNNPDLTRAVNKGYRMYVDNYYSGQNNGWYSGVGIGQFRSTIFKNNMESHVSYWSAELFFRSGYKHRFFEFLSLDSHLNLGTEKILGDSPDIDGDKINEVGFYHSFGLFLNFSLKI